MHKLLVLFSIICLIMGVGSILNVDAFYGATMLLAGVLLYAFYLIVSSRRVALLVRPLSKVHEYRTPSEIYEAGSLLEDHKTGRNLGTGCTVYITQKAMDSDYSVELNAKTLLGSNDPSIKVVDLR